MSRALHEEPTITSTRSLLEVAGRLLLEYAADWTMFVICRDSS